MRDANNLYGCGMNQLLPHSDFNFLTKKEIHELCLDCISENSPIGYILEGHSDYPLAPEKLDISSNILPKYCSDIANKYGIKIGGVNKLVANLRDKVKYVFHYRNLQLYLKLGMKLIEIHRILKFKQSNWLKEYIEFNTKKRTKAKEKFSQNFFKLLVNSIYGKTCGNITKRINVKLINNSKDCLRCVSKPNFVSHKIYKKKFIAAHQIKICVNFKQTSICWILYVRT